LSTLRFLPVTLLIALVATSPLLGQDYLPNRVPTEMRGELSSSGGYTAAAPAKLPDAPTPHRVIDKKFILVMGALGGAESFRFTSRRLVLENEMAAGAPWVTSIPSNQRVIAKYMALYSSEFLTAYELKKPHSWLPGDRVVRRLWWVYPAAMTFIHIKNAVGNVRTQRPGGCTSIECAEQMQMQ